MNYLFIIGFNLQASLGIELYLTITVHLLWSGFILAKFMITLIGHRLQVSLSEQTRAALFLQPLIVLGLTTLTGTMNLINLLIAPGDN